MSDPDFHCLKTYAPSKLVVVEKVGEREVIEEEGLGSWSNSQSQSQMYHQYQPQQHHAGPGPGVLGLCPSNLRDSFVGALQRCDTASSPSPDPATLAATVSRNPPLSTRQTPAISSAATCSQSSLCDDVDSQKFSTGFGNAEGKGRRLSGWPEVEGHHRRSPVDACLLPLHMFSDNPQLHATDADGPFMNLNGMYLLPRRESPSTT